MTPLRAVGSLGVLLLSGCETPTAEQQFVLDAAEALGGRNRVLAVATLVLEGDGRQFNLGQDIRPGASSQTFSVTSVKRQIDVAHRRARTELTRTPNFLYFQGPQAQRQVQGVDGTIAYSVAANGTATRVGGQAADDRRAELYHHPITIVAAALAPAAMVANLRAEGGVRQADVTTEDGIRLVLSLDAAGQPTRVASRSYHANLGDVVLSTAFGDYQDVEGVRLPAHIVSRTDDFTTADFRFTKMLVNATTDELSAPAAAASAPVPTPAAPNVVAEQVAPGVWLLGGQSHHSALIELSDRLILVDAPQSEARALAVIAKARELQPKKPLTDLITTHHHFDHTAGLRAAIAEGLKVITHEGNRAFVEEMAERPHTIVVDALARNPKRVSVETVADQRVIEDPLRRVGLYHVAGNPHSDTMLMVHLPAERVLVQVDAFSPGQYHPYAANLLENITRRGLRVDRVVPLHGSIVPFAELVKLRTTS